jgi:lipoprotein-releasing system ATP-binding protein
MTNILQLTNISKKFSQGNQDFLALDKVNFEVAKSEIIALIGPSGSGKTTLLQIAGLLDLPTSGQVLINGTDTSKANDKTRTEIRKNDIGFVYQFHHLLPEFSALENVALPLLIRGESRQIALQKAKRILTEVDLANREHHKPSALSGGQQQRVAIARAIIGKPSLILADEPTGNLDSASSEKVFELLQNLTTLYSIGCLIVTHNLALAKRCDKLLSIKDGIINS